MSVALPRALTATDAGAAGVTPFELGAHQEPIVAVQVSGEGPFRFALDTGSSHSAISESLAKAIGARAVAQSLFSSSLGAVMRPIVRLDLVEIGSAAASPVFASVIPDESLDATGRIQGVVGQDILSARRYTLDFEHLRVRWNPQSGVRTPRGLTLPLRKARERFLVELPQNGSTLSLVPDSGAEGLVLYRRPDIHLPPLSLTTRSAAMATLTAEQVVRQVNVLELRIGSAVLRDVPAVLLDHADPSAGDGLLPLTLFGRVTFDGPAMEISLEPRSSLLR